MGFHYIGQAGLLTSGDPPASASQSAGITGVSHCIQPVILSLIFYLDFRRGSFSISLLAFFTMMPSLDRPRNCHGECGTSQARQPQLHIQRLGKWTMGWVHINWALARASLLSPLHTHGLTSGLKITMLVRLGVVAHTCNPSTLEAKAGRSSEVGSSRSASPTW